MPDSNIIATYSPLEDQDRLISTQNVTSTVWENYQPTLTTYWTSSVQAGSATGQFYYNVWGSEEATGSVQFAIAYCDADGSGSFGNQSSSYFYAVPIERSGYKEELLPGSWTLALSGSTGITTLYLTDDSKLGGSAVFSEAGRVYNIVTGSAGAVNTDVNTNGWTESSGSYGWFLPDIATLILSGEALSGSFADGGIQLDTDRTINSQQDNPKLLFADMVAGSSVATSPGWTLNSQEQLSSNFIFCRARSQNFNYSTNPSFISGSSGAVLFPSFINDPQVYITTVGLYNRTQELVAVAKLSRPLLKDFTKELLVRIKLDF